MTEFALIYPMFAMVLLTFVVLIALFRTRTQSVRTRKVSAQYFQTYHGEIEPDSSIKLSRHFANIFEAPTLFYIACVSALAVGQNAIAFHLLAWAYVALRAAHACIHIGSNKLRQRVKAYFASWGVLLLMWMYLAVGLAFS